MLDKIFGAGKSPGAEKKAGPAQASAIEVVPVMAQPKPRRANLEKRFTIIAETGQGSMSRVFRAADNESGRTVCLKVQDMAKTAAAASRSAQAERPSEGAIGLRIVHPNVVRTLEFGVSTKGEAYIVMEFIDGYSLNFIRESRKCDLGGKLELLAQAAEGLAAMHAAGFIHHDVGPKNMLVDRDDRLKLIDFGLAVPNTAAFHRPGNRTGTLQYMAPELLRREPTDERIDIFSFGVTMYEFLTGKLPYDATNSMAMMLQRINHDPVDIAQAGPYLPADVCEVVRKAMARSAKDRWPSMAALAQALRELPSVAASQPAAESAHEPVSPQARAADDIDFLESLGVAVPELGDSAASVEPTAAPEPAEPDAELKTPPVTSRTDPRETAGAADATTENAPRPRAVPPESAATQAQPAADPTTPPTFGPGEHPAVAPPSRTKPARPAGKSSKERTAKGHGSVLDREKPADVDFFESLGVAIPDAGSVSNDGEPDAAEERAEGVVAMTPGAGKPSGVLSSTSRPSARDAAESSIPKEVRKEVWKRDRGRCVVCGGEQELKFKHIVSIAKGGQEVAENIRLLCKPCRHAKPSSAQESA